MYHELAIQGRPLCRDFRGHVPYAVPERELVDQLLQLADHGWRGVSLGESVRAGHLAQNTVAITFDDGCNTNLIAAALLKQAGFSATFYIISGLLGRNGYLSAGEVRELFDAGFEIGSHSMDHRYLPTLCENDLRKELLQSKDQIEQIIGSGLEHLSCPGGFWSRTVAELAKQFGYSSVATSASSVNTARTDPYRLGRVPMKSGVRAAQFGAICRGNGLFVRRAKDAILSVPKALLGPTLYVKCHSALHVS